jgi:hypothetical protein
MRKAISAEWYAKHKSANNDTPPLPIIVSAGWLASPVTLPLLFVYQQVTKGLKSTQTV